MQFPYLYAITYSGFIPKKKELNPLNNNNKGEVDSYIEFPFYASDWKRIYYVIAFKLNF
jgi:hypothetical protein